MLSPFLFGWGRLSSRSQISHVLHSFLFEISLFGLSFCTKNDSLFTKYYSFLQFRREVSKRYFVIHKGYFFSKNGLFPVPFSLVFLAAFSCRRKISPEIRPTPFPPIAKIPENSAKISSKFDKTPGSSQRIFVRFRNTPPAHASKGVSISRTEG